MSDGVPVYVYEVFFLVSARPVYMVTSPVIVIEGETNFRVTLGLDARPIPIPPDGNFTWTSNGVELISGMGGVVLGVNYIEFASVTRDLDGTTYEVIGENVAGSGSAAFELSVLCKE